MCAERASGRESRLQPFDHLSDIASAGVRWKVWRQKFEIFFDLEDITNATLKRKHLLFNLSDETLLMFNGLENTGGAADYAAAMKALEDKFLLALNSDYEDFRLRMAMQKKQETTDDYYARLVRMSKGCEYETPARHIRSQLIFGMSSDKLRKQIMSEAKITLDKILLLCRNRELGDERATSMEQALKKIKIEPTDSAHIDAIRRQKGAKHKEWQKKRGATTPKAPAVCSQCGEKWHPRPDCPAMGLECYNCGKPNHYAVMCQERSSAPPKPPKPRTRPRRKARQVEEDPADEDDEEGETDYEEEDYEEEEEEQAHAIKAMRMKTVKVRLVSAIAEKDRGKKKRKFRPRCVINIGNSPQEVIVDTGAAVNVLSRKTHHTLSPCPPLAAATVVLLAYGSSKPLPVLGEFTTTLSYGGASTKAKFHVVDRDTETLLGCTSAVKLQIVKFAFDVSTPGIDDLLSRHPKLFIGIGCRKGPSIRLHIDTTVTPVADKHRRIPFHQRAKVKEELETLEEQGIIEKVVGPTPWISPLVVANKPKQPDKVRICIDMRKPNKAIKRERHITPTVDDLLTELTGANIFSKVDLRAGYHQLPLHPKSRYITTFSSHIGLRRYKRLNFGISSAAEVFQNAIRSIIQDLPGVLNVSDDILVYGTTEEEHYQSDPDWPGTGTESDQEQEGRQEQENPAHATRSGRPGLRSNPQPSTRLQDYFTD